MVQTSARLLALLSLLQVRREWTGQELANRLEVTPRTIRRDVDKLRSLGYPVEAAPGVAGGYRLSAGGELPPLLLDDAEAVAVAVGLRTAASGSIAGIEETSVRALAKLEQVLPSRLRRRVSALSNATSAFAIDGPRIDADVLATPRLRLPRRHPPAVPLRRARRQGQPAQHRARRGRLQRPSLVSGRLRSRPRRLAHVPPGPDQGPGARGRPWPAAHRPRRGPGGLRAAAAAAGAAFPRTPCPVACGSR